MTEVQKMILYQLACDDPTPANSFALFEKLHRRGLLADDMAGSLLLFMENIVALEDAEMVDRITMDGEVFYGLSVEGRAVTVAMLKQLGTTMEAMKAMVEAALRAHGLAASAPDELRRPA